MFGGNSPCTFWSRRLCKELEWLHKHNFTPGARRQIANLQKQKRQAGSADADAACQRLVGEVMRIRVYEQFYPLKGT